MEKLYYQVIISYPDGHLEEMEEQFKTLEEAKSFSVGMMNSIRATEAYHAHNSDVLLEQKLKKPRYEIYETVGKSHKLVFKGK